MICPERRQPGSLTGSATKAMSLLVTDQIQWRTSAPALSLGRPGIRGLDWDRRSAARLTNATFYLYATFHSNDTSLIFNTTRSLWHTLRRIQGEIRHNSLRSAFGTYSGFSLSPAERVQEGCISFQKETGVSRVHARSCHTCVIFFPQSVLIWSIRPSAKST